MLTLVAAIVLGASSASAVDLKSIDALYWHRDQGRNLEKHIAELDALLKVSPRDPELNWRWGRAVVRRGERQTRKAPRLADFLLAEDALRRAVAAAPNSADAHFYYGVALGRRGETQGILKSLFLLKPIQKEMHEVLRLDPKYCGAHRVLGEILWQVPRLAGGDKRRAITEFEYATQDCPHATTNYLPLAEADIKLGRKDAAIFLLEGLLSEKEPDDPAAAPGDLAEGRKLLKTISP